MTMFYAGSGAPRLAFTLLLAAGALAGCGGSTVSSSSATTVSGTTPIGNNARVQLAWEPNADAVAGYIIYHGTSADDVNTVASTVSINSAGFNPQLPAITYAAGDLNLSNGSNVCFRLRAYNSDNALSGWSQAACGTI